MIDWDKIKDIVRDLPMDKQAIMIAVVRLAQRATGYGFTEYHTLEELMSEDKEGR